MGKNKGYRSMMAFIFCLMMVIVLPVAVFFGARKTVNYRINGTEVEAEVTVSEKHGRRRYVESMYKDGQGRFHYVETTYNGIASVGDKFTGYVLPEDPEYLYRMPDLWLVIVFGGVFGLLFFGSLYGVYASAKTHHENRMLSQKGIPVKAEVVTVTRRGDFVFDCNINFYDEDRTLQTTMVTFTKGVPSVGMKCSAIYYKKKNGGIVCDIIEL